MKCPYNDFECDWPVSTGDIECGECVHYNKEIKSTATLDWVKKLFTNKWKKQVKSPQEIVDISVMKFVIGGISFHTYIGFYILCHFN